MYDVSKDTLHVASVNYDEFACTKRAVLSQISKLYDPIGTLSPISVRGKILMRRIWESQVPWDIELPDDIKAV